MRHRFGKAWLGMVALGSSQFLLWAQNMLLTLKGSKESSKILGGELIPDTLGMNNKKRIFTWYTSSFSGLSSNFLPNPELLRSKPPCDDVTCPADDVTETVFVDNSGFLTTEDGVTIVNRSSDKISGGRMKTGNGSGTPSGCGGKPGRWWGSRPPRPMAKAEPNE